MNIYDLTVPQYIRTLGQVHCWLDKAQAYADQKKFDVQVLLGSRLAPDQFPLLKQIQTLGDLAKNTSARLAGIEPPRFEDDEVTMAEIRARVDKTIKWLEALTPAQFEGAEKRHITLFFAPGKYMVGAQYAAEFAIPNVYFHATTAYAILRANGVDLGKIDFIGGLSLRDAEPQA